MESFEIERGTQFLKLFVQKITFAYIPFPFMCERGSFPMKKAQT
jgi:hypothetical protein